MLSQRDTFWQLTMGMVRVIFSNNFIDTFAFNFKVVKFVLMKQNIPRLVDCLVSMSY